MKDKQAGTDRFKEELEILASMQRICFIKFYTSQGNQVSLYTRINQLYTEDEVDYVLMDDGLRIPLNLLVEVNGVRPENLC